MMIHRTLGQAAELIDNILNCRVVVALLQKEALGNVQNPLHRNFRVFIPCHWLRPPLTYIRYVSIISAGVLFVKAEETGSLSFV